MPAGAATAADLGPAPDGVPPTTWPPPRGTRILQRPAAGRSVGDPHGGEVVVDIAVGFSGGGGGLFPPTLRLLVYDLRAE